MELKYVAIIPNRGNDRKELLEWQKQRAIDMGYDHVYLIDYEPKSDAVDIYERLEAGARIALEAGADYCSIIESDDYYSLEYLKTIKAAMAPDVVLFGINQTTYYHLFSTGWRRMSHPGRSSLFCTTFKVKDFYQLPAVTTDPYVDLVWWQHVVKNEIPHQLINDDIAVGIKHGNVFGKVGGNGHFLRYSHFDLSMKLLRGLTDKKAFAFFNELKWKYQDTWNRGQKAN